MHHEKASYSFADIKTCATFFIQPDYFLVSFCSVCSMNSLSESVKRKRTGYHSIDGASQMSRCCPLESGGGALSICNAFMSPSGVPTFSCAITLNVHGSASRCPATKKVHADPGLNFA